MVNLSIHQSLLGDFWWAASSVNVCEWAELLWSPLWTSKVEKFYISTDPELWWERTTYKLDKLPILLFTLKDSWGEHEHLDQISWMNPVLKMFQFGPKTQSTSHINAGRRSSGPLAENWVRSFFCCCSPILKPPKKKNHCTLQEIRFSWFSNATVCGFVHWQWLIFRYCASFV